MIRVFLAILIFGMMVFFATEGRSDISSSGTEVFQGSPPWSIIGTVGINGPITVQGTVDLGAGVSITTGPIQFSLNGVDTTVLVDTGAPANTKPLPVILYGTDGTASQNVNGSISLNGTSSVAVTNFPLVQAINGTTARSWTLAQSFDSVTAFQGGSWTMDISNWPSIQAVLGTLNIANFPAVQVIYGTTSLSPGAATSANQSTEITSLGSIDTKLSFQSTAAKQDSLLASAGSINSDTSAINSKLAGTIAVELASRFATQIFPAAGTGTLSISLGKGISEITIDLYDPDGCTGDSCTATDKVFTFYASIDGINWRSISCSDGTILDDQVPIDTGTSQGFFRCPVSGFETFRMIANGSTKRAALNISASAANSMIQQIQAQIFCSNCSGGAGGGGLTDTELRATPVPVSISSGAISISSGTVGVYGITGASFSVTGTMAGALVTSTDVSQYATVFFNASFSGSNTLQVQFSDGIGGWIAGVCSNPANAGTPRGLVSSITQSANYICPVQGKNMQILITSFTSGSTFIVGYLSTTPFSPVHVGTYTAVGSGTLDVVTAVTGITNAVTVNPLNISGGTLGVIQTINGGTLAVSTVGGVVTTNGTIVQGAAGSSPWLTTSTVGTLTKVTTVDTITNVVTTNGTMVIATGSNVIGSISNTAFTANAGTNLNTSALALETGGNLAAMKTATDTINSNSTSIVNNTSGINGKLPSSLGQKTSALSMAVVLPSDQTVSTSGTITANPPSRSSVSISVNESAAATTAATWYKKRQYQVPSGSTFWPARTKSVVTTAGSRTFIGTGVVMGSLNVGTNAFTDASSVSSPRFFSRMFGCVTTVLSAASDNITVTYTDNLGNTGHTTVATTFAASSPVGDCFEFPLAATTGQMRDTGFTDVTNITDSAATTGVIEIIGMTALHDALGVANAYEMGSFDNEAIGQNEFVWTLLQQAAVTAQQRGATILGSVTTP